MKRVLAGSSLLSELVGFASLVGVVSILPGFVAFVTWADVHALRSQWTVKGPPCPVVAQPAPWAVGHKPPRTLEYGGVEFTRSFGAASCADIPEARLFTRATYRVCQFNNPGAVTVSVGGRSIIFQPPVGQRATVTVRDGAASCVVGGRFSL